MKITLTPIENVTPYDRNPRNTEAATEAVLESIKAFGFRQPIVVDEAGIIIAGHARYFAAIKLGLDKVPVHVAKDLTPVQVTAYRLADNKTADLATWNDDLLAKEILSLTEAGSEIDLAAFGFDQSFLDGIGDQVSAAISDKHESATKQLTLRFGKYSVPLDESEFGRLVSLLTDHESRTGSRYGFVTWLVDKSEGATTEDVSS